MLLAAATAVTFHAAVLAAPLEPTPSPTMPAATQSSAAVVAQVSFANQDDLNRMAGELDIWHVDHDARQVTALLTPAQLRRLRDEGRRVTVDAPATTQVTAWQVQAAASPTADGIPSFPCYRTVEESYAGLVQLAADYPDLVRPVTIGQSWQYVTTGGSAGYPIEGVILTNQATSGPKPVFFLIAAIHARELATAETAMRFAEMLVQGYGIDADATWLLDHTEIHVVPQSNPDGRKKAESGLFWRKNTNDSQSCFFEPNAVGVDLNRNSSFRWNQCTGFGCSNSDACAVTYRGPAAASEPETQAVEAYMRAIFADRRGPLDSDAAPDDTTGVMVSLHSYAPLVLYPWGWTQATTPNADGLRTLARKFGFYTGYDACQAGANGCLYMTDGTTDDFAYGELGIAGFTFELGTEFFQACSTYESTIVTSTLDALTYAAKAARLPYVAPAAPEIISATVALTQVVSGQPITLTVTADDTRRTNTFPEDFPEFDLVPDAVQAIQAVRYTVDAPSWALCGFAQPMDASDGAFDTPVEAAYAVIDTHGWAPGRHLVLVEGQDTDGVWGVPTGVFVDVADHNGNVPAYVAQPAACVELRLPWIIQDREP